MTDEENVLNGNLYLMIMWYLYCIEKLYFFYSVLDVMYLLLLYRICQIFLLLIYIQL